MRTNRTGTDNPVCRSCLLVFLDLSIFSETESVSVLRNGVFFSVFRIADSGQNSETQ
jgi:hypothetical protein